MLPHDWAVVPLRYAAKIGTGHTPDRAKPEYWQDCTVPWVTASDLSSRSAPFAPLLDTQQYVSELGIQHSAAVVHPAGTVMLCRTASVGLFTMIGRPMATTQAFVTWTPIPGVLEPRFLLYTIAAMAPEWDRLAYGSTHRTIYMPDLEGLRIPLPPLDEQRRIADFLDAEMCHIETLASLRTQQLALLPLRWRAHLDQVRDGLVRRFGEAPLGRGLARIEQGTSPQCESYPAGDGEWGVLKAGAVKGDEFLPYENKRLPDDLEPETRYEIRPGDLLVTRANTPALVGAAAVVPNGARPHLILCDKIFRLRLRAGLEPRFVALLSQASAIRDARASAATGASSSMVNLTNADVKSWPIPAAPVAVQREAVNDLAVARGLQRRLERALAEQVELLTERCQALITAAVTGQLDVTTARGVSA